MRIVLGEDLTLLRDGLVRLLAAYDMHVVAAVDNGPELVDAMVEHRPDVAVIDVRLPPTFTDEGLRAAITARRRVPGLPVLVLSQHVEQLYARELMSGAVGGFGYLLKDRVSDVVRFVEAVRTVAAGGSVMDPEVVSQMLARHARDVSLARLTSREREVLALMAEGRSNAAIAQRMVVTEKAISKHINSIFTKLDLHPAGDDNRRVLAVLTYLNALSGRRGILEDVRVGIAHHLGWAVAVTVSACHVVVDRRRIELIEPGMPAAPVEHETRHLSDAAAAGMVAEVRASALRATSASLEQLAASLPGAVLSMSLRAWPLDFPDDIVVQRRPPYESQADSVMYRQVLAECAYACGWEVHLFDAKGVEAQAARILGERAADVLHGSRAALGPPWTRDHRVALAAAIVAS